ncbi:hypothetical protein [Salmonella enterica]|uniref:hypothetical protein n=1 Tax=Salmonella enterica TaxID=28901 RepID=UPI001E459E19|nr:hypothetical protein [Salmonella enterica]
MLTSKEAKNNANNHSLQACQSGTWRKVGSGELQIATAQATGWRFSGATATCPTGKRVTGGGNAPELLHMAYQVIPISQ